MTEVAQALSREAVVAAARALIVDDGLESLSLRRVGASLEVTAPALYAYVSDKADLLQAVADQEFAALRRRFDAVDEPDPVARTRAYCQAYVDHARSQPELFKTMFLFQPELGVGRPAAGEWSSAATETFQRPTQAIDEAMAAGRYQQSDPVLAALTMWAAIHGLAEVLLMGFDFGRDFEQRLIDSVIDTLVRGL